jgi:hypothetical protein
MVSQTLTSVCDKYTKIEDLLPIEQDIVDVKQIWNIVHNSIIKNKHNISLIKDDILRQYPSFEQKAYGYTKFSDFLLGEFENIIYIEDGNCLLL